MASRTVLLVVAALACASRSAPLPQLGLPQVVPQELAPHVPVMVNPIAAGPSPSSRLAPVSLGPPPQPVDPVVPPEVSTSTSSSSPVPETTTDTVTSTATATVTVARVTTVTATPTAVYTPGDPGPTSWTMPTSLASDGSDLSSALRISRWAWGSPTDIAVLSTIPSAASATATATSTGGSDSSSASPTAVPQPTPTTMAKPNSDAVIQIKFPEGSINPGAQDGPQGGAGFYSTPLNVTSATNVTLQYSIFFPEDFDFVKGGKLPGLFGGHTGCSGGAASDNCFSTRLMFRTHGMGELYLYAPKDKQGPSVCTLPPVSYCNTEYGYSLGRGSWIWPTGRWTDVRQDVWLNHDGKPNGGFNVWINDELKLTANEVYYRNLPAAASTPPLFSHPALEPTAAPAPTPTGTSSTPVATSTSSGLLSGLFGGALGGMGGDSLGGVDSGSLGALGGGTGDSGSPLGALSGALGSGETGQSNLLSRGDGSGLPLPLLRKRQGGHGPHVMAPDYGAFVPLGYTTTQTQTASSTSTVASPTSVATSTSSPPAATVTSKGTTDEPDGGGLLGGLLGGPGIGLKKSPTAKGTANRKNRLESVQPAQFLGIMGDFFFGGNSVDWASPRDQYLYVNRFAMLVNAVE